MPLHCPVASLHRPTDACFAMALRTGVRVSNVLLASPLPHRLHARCVCALHAVALVAYAPLPTDHGHAAGVTQVHPPRGGAVIPPGTWYRVHRNRPPCAMHWQHMHCVPRLHHNCAQPTCTVLYPEGGGCGGVLVTAAVVLGHSHPQPWCLSTAGSHGACAQPQPWFLDHQPWCLATADPSHGCCSWTGSHVAWLQPTAAMVLAGHHREPWCLATANVGTPAVVLVGHNREPWCLATAHHCSRVAYYMTLYATCTYV